jgi:hypothetical protein
MSQSLDILYSKKIIIEQLIQRKIELQEIIKSATQVENEIMQLEIKLASIENESTQLEELKVKNKIEEKKEILSMFNDKLEIINFCLGSSHGKHFDDNTIDSYCVKENSFVNNSLLGACKQAGIIDDILKVPYTSISISNIIQLYKEKIINPSIAIIIAQYSNASYLSICAYRVKNIPVSRIIIISYDSSNNYRYLQDDDEHNINEVADRFTWPNYQTGKYRRKFIEFMSTFIQKIE